MWQWVETRVKGKGKTRSTATEDPRVDTYLKCGVLPV